MKIILTLILIISGYIPSSLYTIKFGVEELKFNICLSELRMKFLNKLCSLKTAYFTAA